MLKKNNLDVCVMFESVNELAVNCWGVTSFDLCYKTTGKNTNDMRVHILWWVYDDKLVWKIIISTLISWVLSSELA